MQESREKKANFLPNMMKQFDQLELALEETDDILEVEDQQGCTLLGCMIYDRRVVSLLLRHGVDVNKRQREGTQLKSPLEIALNSNYQDQCLLLLEAGADIEATAQCMDGTPGTLLEAMVCRCDKGHEAIDLLLTYSPNTDIAIARINQCLALPHLPFHLFGPFYSESKTTWLGSEPYHKENLLKIREKCQAARVQTLAAEWRPTLAIHARLPFAIRRAVIVMLCLARREGEEQHVHRLPLELRFLVIEFLTASCRRLSCKENAQALRAACEAEDIDMLKELLVTYTPESVAIDARDASTGHTALHIAALRGWVEGVRLLCDAHANPKVKDRSKLTPAALCRSHSQANQDEIFSLLERAVQEKDRARREGQRAFFTVRHIPFSTENLFLPPPLWERSPAPAIPVAPGAASGGFFTGTVEVIQAPNVETYSVIGAHNVEAYNTKVLILYEAKVYAVAAMCFERIVDYWRTQGEGRKEELRNALYHLGTSEFKVGNLDNACMYLIEAAHLEDTLSQLSGREPDPKYRYQLKEATEANDIPSLDDGSSADDPEMGGGTPGSAA